jgi:hypothetical protein
MFWIFSFEERASRGESVNGHASNAGSASPGVEPSLERIRERAYEIFVARGGEPGHDSEDWIQAERELQAEALADVSIN